MQILRDRQMAFARLSVSERLEWVNFLTGSIADLAHGMAVSGDPGMVRTLLDINHMLTDMREELATDVDATSAEIIRNAESLLRTMRGVSADRIASATIH